MQIHMEETLLWILDGTSAKTWDDEENKRRIDFVHSLGEKCDCVGWSKLNLSNPNSGEILHHIEDFCKENGWTARGYYSRSYVDTSSQWYRLCGESLKESEIFDSMETLTCQSGEELRFTQVKAYAISGKNPKESWGQQCVSEEFLNAYLECGFHGLRFCWLRDVGKYEGTQYFAVAPTERVENILCDKGLFYVTKRLERVKQLPIYHTIQALGGKLPRIAEIFSDLRIELENCYLQKDMPDAQFAYGYLGQTFSRTGENDILIRADVVDKLLNKKVLSKKQIQPVHIVKDPVPGYIMLETEEKPFPAADVLDSRMALYRKLINTSRPKRIVTEKETLKLLRHAKNQRGEDFQKAMPKRRRDLLAGTPYEALMPYYAICESAYICDEFRLLSYQESLEQTREFADYMVKEETKQIQTDGIVIAVCPDGDSVLMTPEKEVLRISHEEPEIISQWSSLEMFFAEETV